MSSYEVLFPNDAGIEQDFSNTAETTTTLVGTPLTPPNTVDAPIWAVGAGVAIVIVGALAAGRSVVRHPAPTQETDDLTREYASRPRFK